MGGARLFARRGSVQEIAVVVDPGSGADGWLLRRIEALSRKPVRTVRLDAIPRGQGAEPDDRGGAVDPARLLLHRTN